MKLKKALKLIKANCKEERCAIGICPLAFQHKDFADCLFAMENIDKWDISNINKGVKRLKKEATH